MATVDFPDFPRVNCFKLPIKWMILASPDNEDYDKFDAQTMISINAHEFIVSSNVYTNKLFKYNINSNTFNECIHGDALICNRNIAFDSKEQILYIHNTYKDQIVSINMKTNMSNSFPCVQHGKHFLFINNSFHMINMHDYHWIGSIQNKSLNTLHNTLHNTINNERDNKLWG
eukprot:275609_1